MKRAAARALAFAALSLIPTATSAASSCIPLMSLASDAMFARYPATVGTGPWRAPDASRGEAHYYRTVFRSEAKLAPNFAGHMQIVRLPCGAACAQLAFVDRSSGSVRSFREVRTVVSSLVYFTGKGADDIDRLVHRPDSRLLVIVGMRNEVESTAGATLYEWRQGKLHLIRFIPLKALCTEEKP
ncbi:MAG: hypothetical protein J7498_11850 [Sphingobium sp.]|nr:hypothetical protein [Sphingobium sp.]